MFDLNCATQRRQRRLVHPALFFHCLLLLCLGDLLAACRSLNHAPTNHPAVELAIQAPVTMTTTPFFQPTACSDHFVTHKLPFATGARLRELNTYESNGAGVAINDLDGDGDLDLVFASIDGESEILWNQGNLHFAEEALDDRYTRGVAIVDVNGDGWLDITFTHRSLESVSYWQNQGDAGSGETGRFVRQPLPGVTYPAYAQAWADLDDSGTLDLVTGSYNMDLRQQDIADPESSGLAGVEVYLQEDGAFTSQRLTQQAETLSIALLDLDGDRQLDIWAANDFDLPDQIWQRGKRNGRASWASTQPFGETSYSTMSIEWGDLENRGSLALFTTDMNPYNTTPTTLATWLPMMNALERLHPHGRSDPQLMANVLQTTNGNGAWRNVATAWGVDATGWSWAAKFGDLDRDGYLDLYVVNGMIAANLFGYLPNGELVEENQAFRNNGAGAFVPMPAWGLGSTASGRGMSMGDLDNDGDLDIVVNNLRKPAELFENQLCGGAALGVDLRWSTALNPYAIGAQLVLHTSAVSYRRDVRASGGYLSGDPARLHVGFPADAKMIALEITWPDGAASRVEALPTNHHITVTR